MRLTIIAAAALGALTLAGCEMPAGNSAATKEAAATAGPAALTVDGSPISQAAFDMFMKARLRDGDFAALPADQQKQLTDDLVKIKVLAMDADKQGLSDDPEIAAQLELQRLNFLAQTTLRRFVEDNPISDEAVEAKIAEQSGAGKEFKARHILVETEEEAVSLIGKLDEGSDFAELAKEHSKDSSAAQGGDLGWFTADKMVKPFSDAAVALEDGSYTKAPVQSQFGWHVILTEERRDAPFGQVANQIRTQMQRDAASGFVDTLLAAAVVKTKSGQ